MSTSSARVVLVLVLVGCGDDGSPAPADGGVERDAGGAADAGARDASTDDRPPMDSGFDAGPPPCEPVADHVVSDGEGSCGRPSLAWNGSGWAVAFSNDRTGVAQIHLALLDAAGTKMGTDHRITDEASAAGQPDIAHAGDGYGVSYALDMETPARIHFARVSGAGELVGAPLDVGQGGGISSLVWNETQYGLAYHSARNAGFGTDIYFARIDASGAMMSDLRVTDDVAPEFIPSADWNGTSYGMVFLHGSSSGSTPGGIYFAAVDASGAEIGDEAMIAGTATGGGARLAASPTGFAVTWGVSGGGVLARLDTGGARGTIPDEVLPRGPSDVIFDGTLYAVAWSMTAAAAGGDVFVATYEPDGASAAGPVQASDGSIADTNAVSIAWDGSGYGVAWSNPAVTPSQVHFAIVCL